MMFAKVFVIFVFFEIRTSWGNIRFTRKNEAPFLVSIRRTEYEQNFGYGHHHCSGALLDPTTVITSASCLYDTLGNPLLEPKSFTVVAGTRYLLLNAPEHGIIRECDRIVKHPDYDPRENSNDIAFLKIVIPFDTTSGEIRPIDISDLTIARDTLCTTYGWGWIQDSGNFTPPTKLQYAGEIKISNRPECSAKLEKFEIELQMDKVCAQTKYHSDGCTDIDPGGVLVCYNKIVGIVSINSDCSLRDFPTVFTHVGTHIPFLRMKREFIDDGRSSLRIDPLSNAAYCLKYNSRWLLLINWFRILLEKLN